MRYAALHEFSGLAAVGDKKLCATACAAPNSMRSGSHVWPNRSSRPVDVSVPPQRSFRGAHTSPPVLAARTDGRKSGRAVRTASTTILGKAGYSSRAGHSNGLQESTTAVLIGWTSWFIMYLPNRKEGIHPASMHGSWGHFSFSRSLFRPGFSEHSFLPTAKSGSAHTSTITFTYKLF